MRQRRVFPRIVLERYVAESVQIHRGTDNPLIKTEPDFWIYRAILPLRRGGAELAHGILELWPLFEDQGHLGGSAPPSPP